MFFRLIQVLFVVGTAFVVVRLERVRIGEQDRLSGLTSVGGCRGGRGGRSLFWFFHLASTVDGKQARQDMSACFIPNHLRTISEVKELTQSTLYRVRLTRHILDRIRPYLDHSIASAIRRGSQQHIPPPSLSDRR